MDVTKQHYQDQKSPVCEKYMALLNQYDAHWGKILESHAELREEKILQDEQLYQKALDNYCTVMSEYQSMRKELTELARKLVEK